MRVIVTGRSGQLARSLVEAPPAGTELITVARPEFDLEQPQDIAALIEKVRPDAVINAAAFTQVDAAEDAVDKAMQINAAAPGVMASAAARAGAIFIQVSTDYVFDGRSRVPYSESASPHPLNAYGRSKLAGEQAVMESGADYLIVRVSWLFSAHGRNFVRTMLDLAEDRDVVDVVDDQRGVPTSARDLARVLYDLAAIGAADRSKCRQIVNAVDGDHCTWADFAEAIFVASARHGGPSAQVRRVGTSAFPTRAIRPVQSVLDPGKLRQQYGIVMPGWRDSIEAVVAELLGDRILAAGSH